MVCNVLTYLENSAEKYPDKIAFAQEKEGYTFEQILNLSKAVGSKAAEFSGSKKAVAVFMDKTIQCFPAFFGAVYAGCFYVPIDTKTPDERILKIFSNLKPTCIICDEKNAQRASALAGDTPVIRYEDAVNTPVDSEKLEKIRNQHIDTDLLYVLFTSGSTGEPKGVTICHKSVIDYTEWLSDTLEFDYDTVFGNQAPFHFDNSVLDIYTTLKQGACMYIIPQKCFSFPKTMARFLNEKQINTIFWVPFALISYANSGMLEKEELKYIKKVYFCGEVMPCKQLNMWIKALPNAKYVNMYGPTEITDVCTYYVVNRPFKDDDSLPIGIPCKNTRIIILDENDKEAAFGEKGELCVAGTSLSFGYYNNPEKTNAAFVQNPLNSAYREIIYRTGDIVKYNEYGEIMYLSRKDFQIKHLGYRIELGEIETALVSVEGVDNGCCLYDDVQKKINCFYTGSVTEDELREQLKAKVPPYMVPDKFVHLEILPQTANGKINRVALKNEYIK